MKVNLVAISGGYRVPFEKMLAKTPQTASGMLSANAKARCFR
jgi:hypothetical protein